MYKINKSNIDMKIISGIELTIMEKMFNIGFTGILPLKIDGFEWSYVFKITKNNDKDIMTIGIAKVPIKIEDIFSFCFYENRKPIFQRTGLTIDKLNEFIKLLGEAIQGNGIPIIYEKLKSFKEQIGED